MRSFIAALIISILILVQPAPVYYVAPYGVSTAAGDADSPKTLAWALASAPSGSTVWIIPGTYAGAFTASAPGVTYRSLPGTRARLDGNVTINAADVTLRDLEITNTSWLTRTGTPTQSTTVVQSFAPRTTLINNWIHDLGQGVGAFNGPGGATADLSLRGNLIYNNGWQGHGHGFYAQNDDAGRKTLSGNIFLPNYGYLVQFYGSGGPSSQLRHFDVISNTFVLGRVLIGGGQPADDIEVRGNASYGNRMEVGYQTNVINGATSIYSNTFGMADLQIKYWTNLQGSGNRFARDKTELMLRRPTTAYTHSWDLNSYAFWGPNGSTAFNLFDGNVDQQVYDFATWRTQSGLDATSVYTSTKPVEPWVIVTPNVDDSQRRTVAIYNWQGAATVSVSLPGLTPGASYKLVNAQNTGEWQTFTAGAPVAASMLNWTVAKPYGDSAALYVSTFPSFGMFLVEPL